MGNLKTGILGGAFDPIHNGHLAAARKALEHFGLDRVILIPNGSPPHKPEGARASAMDRLQMTRLAAEGDPRFSVSGIEINRPGKSYTVDTLQELKREGGPEKGELFFIIGADAALEMLEWREPDRLLELCEFIAVARPGFDLSRLTETLGEARAGKIHTLHVETADISSTEIRRRLAAGEPVDGLMPDSVAAFIREKGLYEREAGIK